MTAADIPGLVITSLFVLMAIKITYSQWKNFKDEN